MRQLLETAQYAPTRARFKVYVIDEVHQLSGHAFNAMLKTLEEPPEHMKFILATTDPQKIPVTVLSRCLQFNLKQMPRDAIASHLANVLTKENIAFEPDALNLLARAAAGSMRDALSLLDQAIAHGGGKAGAASVADMLGAIDQTHLVRLLEVAASDAAGAVAIADEMQARAAFDTALADLASLLLRRWRKPCPMRWTMRRCVRSQPSLIPNRCSSTTRLFCKVARTPARAGRARRVRHDGAASSRFPSRGRR